MRLAFVVPRFAEGSVGGAEQHVRELARRLLDRGHHVEVLTTCAADHHTWENALPAGRGEVDGIPVWRYPVTQPRDDMTMRRLQTALAAGLRLPPAAEEAWVRNTGYSEPLLAAIADLGDAVDALIFTPYLFASTVFGARVRPERSLIQPLLHDEPYARFRCVGEALGGVAGLLWISPGERELGERLLNVGRGWLIGAGVDVPADPPDGEALRRRLRLHHPAVSYAGRRERAKNFPLVAEVVTAANLGWRERLDLLAMGTGPVRLSPSARPFVRDLGYVSDGVKLEAFAASLAVINLSLFESFSYALVEAWSVGTPVIVHSGCAVTRRHCEASGGGLWVADVAEAVEAILRLSRDPRLRRALGAAGRRYVESAMGWSTVIDRMEGALQEFTARAGRRG